MFRAALFITALLLAACSAKQTTPPRTVKFYDVVPKQTLELETRCEWVQADVLIFNQQGQRVKFRYKDCSDLKFMVGVRSGTELTIGNKEVIAAPFYIKKQGALSEQRFVNSLIYKAHIYKGICRGIKTPNGWWKIIDDKSISPKIHAMPCGRFGSVFGKDSIIVFKGGIVLILPRGLESTKHNLPSVDFSSITYENRG